MATKETVSYNSNEVIGDCSDFYSDIHSTHYFKFKRCHISVKIYSRIYDNRIEHSMDGIEIHNPDANFLAYFFHRLHTSGNSIEYLFNRVSIIHNFEGRSRYLFEEDKTLKSYSEF